MPVETMHGTLNPHRIENAGERALVEWQYRRALGADHFDVQLMKLISTADSENQDRLAKGFPDHVRAYRYFAYKNGYWTALERRAHGQEP